MDWWITFDQQAADYLPDLRIEKEEPMDRHTSFRIGGPARRMAFPERGEQLVLLLDMAARCGARPLVMGNGTNLLAPDEGLDRLVIDTSAGLSRVEAGGTPGTILAEAGASLARVADFACRQGLAGLEFAHGIPGTVGGAVCMNAGAYGGEMAQVVREATLLLPEEGIRTLTGAEMAFGYRRSFLTDHPDAVVLRAEFCLTPGDPAAIRGRMKELLEKRRASQPLEFPSAGSTFKRPEGYYAGTLIDQCGLKGLTVGGAQVSEKHAGFVINRGGATCADVKELIRQIQERVFAQAGVRLEISADYGDLGKIQYLMGQQQIPTLNSSYTDSVYLEALVPASLLDSFCQDLTEGTAGKAVLTKGDACSYAVYKGDILLFDREDTL